MRTPPKQKVQVVVAVNRTNLAARILPILNDCHPKLRAGLAQQLATTGQFVTPYGSDALFKVVWRQVHAEYIRFQIGRAHV